ncbi:MAG: alpha/beta hydrolase [Bacilli bacterium]|nr:alpha/beta hydrolase [Bacilli bacterium]
MKKNKYYTVEKIKIPSTGRDIKVLIVKPVKNAKPKDKTPGIVWLHGGGYATGMPEMIYFTRALSLVKKYGAVLVVPDYRLSTEAPYPAALEDCYSALKYLKNHTDELGVNSSQLMVGGESAGGGLTAALCIYARDKKEVNIAFQMPLYPMLDDRDTESSRDNHAQVWNTKRNHKAWKMYLGELYGKEVPSYAAPARETDYSNLPPAYTFVGDIEPFYCETLTYIENLKKAGIEACVDVYEDWFHAYDLYHPLKKITKKAIANFEKEFVHATKNYFAKQER